MLVHARFYRHSRRLEAREEMAVALGDKEAAIFYRMAAFKLAEGCVKSA